MSKATKDAKCDGKLFGLELNQKGYYISIDNKFKYVYNNSNYIRQEQIWLSSIGSEFKRITEYRYNSYLKSTFSKKEYYISMLSGTIVRKIGEKYFLLKTSISKGYKCVTLRNDKYERCSLRISRLILITYFEQGTGRTDQYQDYSLLEADNIDKIRHNDCISNLRFLTSSENTKYSHMNQPLGLISENKYSNDEFLFRKNNNTLEFDVVVLIYLFFITYLVVLTNLAKTVISITTTSNSKVLNTSGRFNVIVPILFSTFKSKVV